jgi:hypothetical protein
MGVLRTQLSTMERMRGSSCLIFSSRSRLSRSTSMIVDIPSKHPMMTPIAMHAVRITRTRGIVCCTAVSPDLGSPNNCAKWLEGHNACVKQCEYLKLDDTAY